MTKVEYVKLIARLYRVANLSYTDSREPWLNREACVIHCKALELIVADLGLLDVWGDIFDDDFLIEDEVATHYTPDW